ncbi:MAG: DUF2062 domain-containing protein [Synechococcaceae bacterium WB9_4xB_025]|nr:DUF2062 domain-containing protein [Synechococcaceae bacterium WB9_4xB_025]
MARMLLKDVRTRASRAITWVWEQEGTPGQRARGVGAGVFCGCFPFFGLQIILSVGVASLLRGNHLLAAAATLISNPFTYVPLYWFNYQVGDALIGNGQGPALNSISRSTLWEQGWGFSSRLLLGSAVVATVLAILMGVLAFLVFRRNQVSAKTTRHP